MAINITTDGPLFTAPTVITPKTGTLGNLIQIIADEIDDTTSEYVSQIQEAIFSAIRFCERYPFYFNESRDVTFMTTRGREWYGLPDIPAIATIAGLQAVYCDMLVYKLKLRPATPQEIEILDGENLRTGEPSHYLYYGQKIRIYPIPNATYLIRLQVAPVRFPTVKTIDEQNPWFVEAFDMIKARAKYELYKDILKDASMAGAALNDFNEQLEVLRAETSRRHGTGKVRATGF